MILAAVVAMCSGLLTWGVLRYVSDSAPGSQSHEELDEDTRHEVREVKERSSELKERVQAGSADDWADAYESLNKRDQGGANNRNGEE